MTGLHAAVYMATNKTNGKAYIGATVNFGRRKKAHLARAFREETGCPRFYAAIRKYGVEAFEWKVLRKFGEKSCAFSFERIAIYLKKPAYNVTEGGGAPKTQAWNKKKVICLEDGEIYESMTAAAKAYGVSNSDVGLACRQVRKTAGGKHFLLGSVPMSQKDRLDKIRSLDLAAANQRRRRSNGKLARSYGTISQGRDKLGRSAAGPMAISRRVVCLDTEEVFESVSAAAKRFDICVSAIVKLLSPGSKRKTAGGYRFGYLDS